MTVTSGSPRGTDETRVHGAGEPRTRIAAGSPSRAVPQLCPFLSAPGAGWRSAAPLREQQCGALEPPAPLAPDKQRRLCLTAAHAECVTYRVATDGLTSADSVDRGTGAATRWSIGRMAPVVLDYGRVAVVAGLARRRTGPQLALGGVMALTLAVLVLARLPASGDPTLAGLTSPSPTGAAVAATTARPTARGSPRATPGGIATSPSATPAASSVAASPSASAAPPATAPPTQPPPARTYVVRSGDTLYGIAIRFGTTVRTLQGLNELGSSTNLRIGQRLRLP